MPKLSKAKAKAVNEAESSFAPLDEGIYVGKLADVESREGPAGEYWSWRFESLVLIEGEVAVSGSLWVNTSLAENSEWKLQECFEAFGVPSDTDTDTLLGSWARLVVSQRVIEKGSRMGEVGNQVDRVMPVEEDDPTD